MDSLTLALIGAVINGISLMLGIYLGSRMTGNVLEKKVLKIMNKSPLLNRVSKLVEALEKILGDERTIQEITAFFKAGKELMQSPEAKNFFKNATDLMKDFSGEGKVKLKMPKKKSA